jgi:hypothetical protein
MEKQKSIQSLGVLERLAIIAVPIIFTIMVVASATHAM